MTEHPRKFEEVILAAEKFRNNVRQDINSEHPNKKTLKAWAVINTLDDGFVPDIQVGHIGSLYHIHSSKKEADNTVKSICDSNWKVVPVEITYEL